MSYLETIKSELTLAAQVLNDFMNNEDNLEAVEQAADLMVDAFNNKLKVISCGNGGSNCDATHFAEELTGKFREDREPFPAISINDSGYITCTANDFGYDRVFSRFIRGMGQKGDVLLAISTSGNSRNVVRAAEIAKQRGLKVVGLTGKNTGELGEFCDVQIKVPYEKYADRIQEVHIKIIHILIHLIEQKTK
ncbi:D-sedoheptulose 7-phosphate isomerase [Cyclobacteriaceae bacterium]|nr:D-sedoheptulose 7-phosphate isomerase [Cyclobacteriaceae bacterium]